MIISIYGFATETFVPTLQSLPNILDKGAEHARANNSDSAALVNARSPRHVHALAAGAACVRSSEGCDGALTGKDPPQFEDNEQTLEELKARIAKTIGYVEMCARPFDGAEDRRLRSRSPRTHGVRDERASVPERLGVAAFLFSRRHRVRHPAPQGRRHRQTRLFEPRRRLHRQRNTPA